MADPLAREALALYGLPRDEFTAARNARAKELKQDDAELAAAVAALPKPSVAAAAVNKLARDDPSEVRALIQSGKRLREAQQAAVSGKKGADLNAAVQEHRAGLDRVQRELRGRKLSSATLDKALQTVRVASVDPELQPLLERGTLNEDLTSSGFGLDPGIVPVRKRPGKPAAKRDDEARELRRREARERLEEARSALAEAKRTARAAEKRAVDAQRVVERAAAELERARRAAADA